MSSEAFRNLPVDKLVSLCVDNNTEAWNEFNRRFHSAIMLYSCRESQRYNLKEVETLEVVQELFLRLLVNDHKILQEFRGTTEEELNVYLALVVRSIVWDKVRKETTQKRAAKTISLNNPVYGEKGVLLKDVLIASEETSPEFILDKKIAPKELQQILASVLTGPNASRDAIIFYLHIINDLSAREIAELPIFSMSATHIQVTIFRTRERLREALAKKNSILS